MSNSPFPERDPFFPFALEAGGSHYPGVGGDTLRYYGRLIAEECARVARQAGDDPSGRILARFELLPKNN